MKGAGQKKKAKAGPTAADLKRRGKQYSISGNNFFCPGRYQPKECLGKGAYGVVCRCIDRWTRKQVAIKKVAQISRSTGTLKQILREVRLMRKMDAHPLTVSLLDLYQRDSKDEIYLVMELMTTDLHQVIQSDQALTGLHIQHFTYQILRGIEFIHSCGVLHRDLKPGNLLVNTSCDLKIADFGLSRTSADAGMTELVVTRWYRSPELILNPNGGYGKSVDLWSVGCIFAELLGRKPLFPGKQFVHQLQLIFDVLGTPAPEDVAFVTNPNARDFLDGLKPSPSVPFSKIFPHVSAEALDFVTNILRFRESDRMTTEQCLAHPFMQGAELNCPLPDVTAPADMECLFENFKLSKGKLKRVIAKEVGLYKKLRSDLVNGVPTSPNSGPLSTDSTASTNTNATTTSSSTAAGAGAGTGTGSNSKTSKAGSPKATAAAAVAAAGEDAAEGEGEGEGKVEGEGEGDDDEEQGQEGVDVGMSGSPGAAVTAKAETAATRKFNKGEDGAGSSTNRVPTTGTGSPSPKASATNATATTTTTTSNAVSTTPAAQPDTQQGGKEQKQQQDEVESKSSKSSRTTTPRREEKVSDGERDKENRQDPTTTLTEVKRRASSPTPTSSAASSRYTSPTAGTTRPPVAASRSPPLSRTGSTTALGATTSTSSKQVLPHATATAAATTAASGVTKSTSGGKESIVERYRSLVRKNRNVPPSAVEAAALEQEKKRKAAAAAAAAAAASKTTTTAAEPKRTRAKRGSTKGMSRLDRLVKGVPVFADGAGDKKARPNARATQAHRKRTAVVKKKAPTKAYSPKWSKRRSS